MWATDYDTVIEETDEDKTKESKAIIQEGPAPKAKLPESTEQPIVNPEPKNL